MQSALATVSNVNLWTRLLLAVGLLTLILLGLECNKPPRPVSATASPAEFSAERAMPRLLAFAQNPHFIGTAENGKVREYLIAELRALGLEPQVQTALGVFHSPRKLSTGIANNILVRIPGIATDRAKRKAIMLTAHYDSVPHGPGAADDGASVAAILETLRALQNGPALENDLVCMLTDGEEVNLIGAEAFVAEHPWAQGIGLVFNFEYRGNRGPMMMYETSPGNGRLIEGFAQAVAQPVGTSLNYELYKRLTNDSDLTAFKAGGLQGLNFAAIEGHPVYHTALDRPESLDQASLQHQGDIMLALVRYFGRRDLSSLQGSDRIYFDFPGLGLVHYPMEVAVPLALTTAVLFLAMCAWRVRTLKLLVRRVVNAFVAFVLLLAVVAAGTQIVWSGVQWLHPGYRLMLKGSLYNGSWYLLAVAALVISTFAIAQQRLLRWFALEEWALGCMLAWVLLLLGISIIVPGASFMLNLPLLPVLIGTCVLLKFSELQGWMRAGVLLLGAAPAILLLTPILRSTYIAIGPNFIFVVVILLLLLQGLLAELLVLISRPLFATLGGLGLLLFLMGSATAGFDALHPQPSNLFYVKDGQSGQSLWVSDDERLDDWTQNFFPATAQRGQLPELFGEDAGLFWSAPAPESGVAAPRITVVEDRSTDGARLLTVDIQSSRLAPQLLISVEGSVVLRSEVNGHKLTDEQRGAWMLRANGMKDEVVRLKLKVGDAKAFRIRVRERSFGLPANEMPVRPSTIIPQPNGFSYSTLSVRVLEFNKP